MNWKQYLTPLMVGSLFGTVLFFAGDTISAVLGALPILSDFISMFDFAPTAVSGGLIYTAMEVFGINKAVGAQARRVV